MPRNDEVGPRLPINNRASGSPRKKGGGRGRGLASQRAWADYTPTPWLDHTPTPWSTLAAVSEFAAGPFGMPQHHHSMGQPTPHHDGSTADDALEQSNYWAPTPTPSGFHQMMYGFGDGMPMPGLPLQPPPMFAAAAMAAAAGAAAGAAAAAASASLGVDVAEASPDDEVLPTAAEQDVTDEGADETTPGSLPSRGSDLHAAGKCRPCAWFWKEQGCQNAQACGYCHLCPEGELRSRKKSKVAAMRAGALGSAKAGNTTGATRTLKLTPLV